MSDDAQKRGGYFTGCSTLGCPNSTRLLVPRPWQCPDCRNGKFPDFTNPFNIPPDTP